MKFASSAKFLIAILIGIALLQPISAAAYEDGRKVKKMVQPQYPELARSINMKGTVRVEVTITPHGNVKSAKVLGGNPVLAESAVEAVKSWQYEPAAAETTTTVVFNFGQ